jgi:O-methyltransferase
MLKKIAKQILSQTGFEVQRISSTLHLSDLPLVTKEIIQQARPFTMTSDERLAAVCSAVEYVTRTGVVGCFVECGVWKGGSSMAAALTYLHMGRQDVDLFLFDTFEGMPAPTKDDFLAPTGELAFHRLQRATKNDPVLARSPIEEVQQNLRRTHYPKERIHFVKGMVEKTIPQNAPEAIAVLRLDTDWYESTRHELDHLFPRLSVGGILIIDDYGVWAGARKAVDEFFAAKGKAPFLFRIDNTGRLYIKTAEAV